MAFRFSGIAHTRIVVLMILLILPLAREHETEVFLEGFAEGLADDESYRENSKDNQSDSDSRIHFSSFPVYFWNRTHPLVVRPSPPRSLLAKSRDWGPRRR